MTRPLTIACLLFVASQVTTAPAATGLIAGRVVDSATNAGVPGVVVTLSPGPFRISEAAVARIATDRVLVDSDGAFVFTHLPKGSYTLRAERSGYAEGAFGRRRPEGVASTLTLQDGGIMADLTIPLWKYAVISGTVADETGKSTSGVQVQALRRQIVAGHGQFVGQGSAVTDDRGAYRIHALPAGDYTIDLGFTPVGRVDLRVASAPMIRLQPGFVQTGIDLHTHVVPTVRVSGRLTGPEGTTSSTLLQLIPVTGPAVSPDGRLAIGTSDAQGAFTFLGVPAGEYVLRAEPSTVAPTPIALAPPKVWAAEPVTVGATDATNVIVALRPALRVQGRVEFVGTKTPPAGQALQNAAVWLVSAASSSPRQFGKDQVDASGRFETAPVAGGAYVVRATAPGWIMLRATAGGRDVADAPLDLNKGDVTDVVVTLTDRLPTIAGVVLDSRGMPDVNAMVLLFPVTPNLWADGGGTPRRLVQTRVDAAGAFRITTAPPGDYYAVAIDAAMIGEWQDPRVLDQLSRVATRLSVVDAESRNVTLKTTTVAIGGGVRP